MIPSRLFFKLQPRPSIPNFNQIIDYPPRQNSVLKSPPPHYPDLFAAPEVPQYPIDLPPSKTMPRNIFVNKEMDAKLKARKPRKLRAIDITTMQDIHNRLNMIMPYHVYNYDTLKSKLDTQSLKRKRDMSEGQDGEDVSEGSQKPEAQANSGSSHGRGASHISAALPTSRQGKFLQDNPSNAVNQSIGLPPVPDDDTRNQDKFTSHINLDPRLFLEQPPFSDTQDEAGPSQCRPVDRHSTADNGVLAQDPNKPFEPDLTSVILQNNLQSTRTNLDGERPAQEQDAIGVNVGLLQGQEFAGQYVQASGAAPVQQDIADKYQQTSWVATGPAALIVSAFSNTTNPTLHSSNNNSPPLIRKLRPPIPAPEGSMKPAGVPEKESLGDRFIDVPGIPTRKATRPSVLRALATTNHFRFIELYPNDLDSEFGWLVAKQFSKREDFIARIHSFHDLPTEWVIRPVDKKYTDGPKQWEEIVLLKLQNRISKWITKWGAYFGRIKGWKHDRIVLPPNGFLDPLTWREGGCPVPEGVHITSHIRLPTEDEVIRREQRETNQQRIQGAGMLTPMAGSAAGNAKRRRTQGGNTQISTSGPSTTLLSTVSPSTTDPLTASPSTTGISALGAFENTSFARIILRGRTSSPSRSAPRQNIQRSSPVITPPSYEASLQKVPPSQQDYFMGIWNHGNIQQGSSYLAGPTSSSPPTRNPPPGYATINENLGSWPQSPHNDFSAYFQTPSDDDDDRAAPDASPVPARFSMENRRVNRNHPPAENSGLNMEGVDVMMNDKEVVWKLDDSCHASHLAAQNLDHIQVPARKTSSPTVSILSAVDQERIDADRIAESNLNVKKALQSFGWKESKTIRRAINELLDFTIGHPGVEVYLTSNGVPDAELEAQDADEYKKIEDFLDLLTEVVFDDCWKKCRQEFERMAADEEWILNDRLEQWEALYHEWAGEDK